MSCWQTKYIVFCNYQTDGEIRYLATYKRRTIYLYQVVGNLKI